MILCGIKIRMNQKQKAKTISVPQLYKMFPTEQSCYEWLEKVRWNGNPVCPHCGRTGKFTKPKSKKHTYWHGLDCRKQFTVTTGTCFHATKKPLQDWIYAIYSVMTARKGVSAMQISKELGCAYRQKFCISLKLEIFSLNLDENVVVNVL